MHVYAKIAVLAALWLALVAGMWWVVGRWVSSDLAAVLSLVVIGQIAWLGIRPLYRHWDT